MRPYCIELPNIPPPWVENVKSKSRHVWIDLDHVQLIEYEMHSAEIHLSLKFREKHPELSDGVMTHSLSLSLTLAFRDEPMVLHGFEYRVGPSSLGLVAERLLAVWGMT